MNSVYAKVESQGKVVLGSTEVGAPGPDELQLQAEYSSLSPGTERSLLAGDILPLPQDIGYSLAATVIDTGRDVNQYQAGDKVVATARHAAVQCVDQRLVTPVPADTDLEQAAFFNLAHTALHGIRRSGLQLGEPALVMGQGLVGALTALLARKAGAAPVIVTDLSNARLEIARNLGAHLAINPNKQPNALAEVIAELGLGGIPAIFEVTGSRGPLEQAVDLVSERGRIMMLSTVHGDSAPNITEGLMMKGATLIGGYVNSKPFALERTDMVIGEAWPPTVAEGSRRYANQDSWSSDEDIRVLLSLIRYGSLDIRSLITHRFSVEEIPQAYDLVWNQDPALIGGLIDWTQETSA